MTKNKKLLILIACECVLLFTMVTGTIAWLTDTSATVTNTFKPSNISISISETAGGTNHEFQMVPGAQIEKNPKVIVEAKSEPCYVFVKVEEDLGAWAGNGAEFSNFLTYSVHTGTDGWTVLDEAMYPGIYYRKMNAAEAAAGAEFSVLLDNKVTVKNTVTKDDMKKLYATGAEMPTLKFTAYAIQSENLPYADNATDLLKAQTAWTVLNNP